MRAAVNGKKSVYSFVQSGLTVAKAALLLMLFSCATPTDSRGSAVPTAGTKCAGVSGTVCGDVGSGKAIFACSAGTWQVGFVCATGADCVQSASGALCSAVSTVADVGSTAPDSGIAPAADANPSSDVGNVSDTAPGDTAVSTADASDAAATVCACGDDICDKSCENNDTCPIDCKACGDGTCSAGESPKSCKVDCCGACGDGKCKGYDCGESFETCPVDCGTACGNKVCEKGESPVSCTEDCKWSVCGNGTCEASDGGPSLCPQDCAAACGDGKCAKGEDFVACPIDCGYCGDGYCSLQGGESIEKCPDDCKAACVPDCEGKECGSDGCGGVCGNCVSLAPVCNLGVCCAPQCNGANCGADGCGGVCGTCVAPQLCQQGQCGCADPWKTGAACDQAKQLSYYSSLSMSIMDTVKEGKIAPGQTVTTHVHLGKCSDGPRIYECELSTTGALTARIREPPCYLNEGSTVLAGCSTAVGNITPACSDSSPCLGFASCMNGKCSGGQSATLNCCFGQP